MCSICFIIVHLNWTEFQAQLICNFQSPNVWKKYQAICDAAHGEKVNFLPLERFDFYKRAKQSYCIVATSEQAPYGNIILKKGCVVVKDEGANGSNELPCNK